MFLERSVNKKGGFQAEVRYALDCARRMPLDDIFVAPVRLDDCRVPRSFSGNCNMSIYFPIGSAACGDFRTCSGVGGGGGSGRGSSLWRG